MNNLLQINRNATENPCHMCMPMGAILPFKGVENSMVIIHGSQGCSTYMRRHMSEHYNEPVDVASSSITEAGTIYGGESNLKKGLDNLIRLYNPELIGILTTCLAETIGEDTERAALSYLKEREMEGFPLVSVPTPGYGGTHTEGYFVATRRIIAALAEKKHRHQGINIIVPNVSPADIREIKRILALLGTEYTLFPDYSETMDSPFSRHYKKISEGGTSLEAIRRMGGARATIQFGMTVDDDQSPGKFLEEEFAVPLFQLPLPVGIRATDLLVTLLCDLAENPAPEDLHKERGRLLDGMIDSHKYNAEGRAVLFGEPELVYALVGLCAENGIQPVVIATGTRVGRLGRLLGTEPADFPERPALLYGADFSTIRKAAAVKGANIAIGHSDGKYLTEKEGLPLVRIGYPIHDRVGGQRILSVGYAGTMAFLDQVTNTLLENKHKTYRDRMHRTYYSETPSKAGI